MSDDNNGIDEVCQPSDYYWYRALCVNVVDGDTIDIETDLGFKIAFDQRVRLFGINTPELNSKDPDSRVRATLAKDFVTAKVGHKFVTINSHKDKTEKFGRYLATVYYMDDTQRWHNLNRELVQLGMAVEAFY